MAEAETQRGSVSCPESHSSWMVEAELKHKYISTTIHWNSVWSGRFLEWQWSQDPAPLKDQLFYHWVKLVTSNLKGTQIVALVSRPKPEFSHSKLLIQTCCRDADLLTVLHPSFAHTRRHTLGHCLLSPTCHYCLWLFINLLSLATCPMTWLSSIIFHKHLLTAILCQELSDAERNQTLCIFSRSPQNLLNLELSVQDSSYWPHMASEPLKCGWSEIRCAITVK